MKYRLIGIDLDGTLLDPLGEVSDANRRAIAAAQDAGALVVPCTGRGWRESMLALDGVPGLSVGVFNTGAVINDVHTGEALDHVPFDPHLVHDIVQRLRDQPEAILAFRERNRVGHEYLVTGAGEIDENTRTWFSITDALVHHQPEVTPDDLHHTLRIGLVTLASRAAELQQRLAPVLDRVNAHAFDAISMPGDEEVLHILEIFAAGVSKWRGIEWVAQQHDIPHDAIAVIGDQVNDVPMIEAAVLGVAMANAVESVRSIADRHTRSNSEDGVAHAIDQMLSGAW